MLTFLFPQQQSFESRLSHYLSETAEKMSESQLHNIMTALRGEDPSIKSEIAFASLKTVITAFESQPNDLRILKELIICDKLVEQNIFCAEISLLCFFAIETHKPVNATALQDNARKVLKLFWKVIKDKSIIMIQQSHVFREKRSQRESYVRKLSTQELLGQIGTVQTFFITVFELVYYLENPSYIEQKEVMEWRKCGVGEYITGHLLYKLFYLYNCQMMMHRFLIHRTTELSPAEMTRLKRCIIKFRENCNQFIVFIKEHTDVRGFENISFEEIRVEVNEKLVKFIEDFLHHREVESLQPILHQLPINLGKLKVEMKPMASFGKVLAYPRMRMKTSEEGHPKKENPSRLEANPFANWQNSYSHEFPQKEVMSVDLILQIKLQQSLNKQTEEQSIDERDNNVYLSSRCSLDNRSTCASSSYCLNFFKIKEYAINVLERRDFQNLYSKLQAKWNE